MNYDFIDMKINDRLFEEIRENDNKVIHCRTKKEAIALVEYCKEQNIFWAGGEPNDRFNTNFDHHGPETCYNPMRTTLYYAELDYYAEYEGEYEIIEFSKLLED